MKSLTIILSLLILISCKTNTDDLADKIILGDTIQTNSGLQYFYVKQGNGRKVERGSVVGTYLSLMLKDSIIWTSNNSTDSLFTFITGNSEVIKGFDEVTILLREGDEVVAILPYSLAYGKKGAGGVIPPFATLVYNELKVVKVSEPKGILSDTLFEIARSKGVEKMIERYNQITKTIDSTNYHTGSKNHQLYNLCNKLREENMDQKAFETASYFGRVTNHNLMRFSIVESLEGLGQINRAIDSLEILIQEEPGVKIFISKRLELEEKLKKQ